MKRKILFLATAIMMVMQVAAQTNNFEEIIDIDVRDNQLILTATVAGAPLNFLLDMGRASSAILTNVAHEMGLEVSNGRVTLERIGIGEELFVPRISVDVIDDEAFKQLGVSGVLGVNVFNRSVVTIDKEAKNITLSAPFKPEHIPLRSRSDMVAGNEQTVVVAGERVTAPISELFNKGAMTFDFTRSRLFFESFETLVRPERVVAVAEEPKMEGLMTHLTRNLFLQDVFNFREKDEWEFQGSQPAILYFWATWCAPCRRLTPGMVQLAEEFEGRVKFYKINFDEEPEISVGFFNVQTLPTMLFVPMVGEPVSLGLVNTKEDVRRRLEELME
jgi:thiol-disulfide isomerase/thioredoxin